MKPGRSWAAAMLGLTLLVAACRDEQAGPHPKTSAAHAPPRRPAAHVTPEPPADLTFRSGATWGQGALEYLGARVSRPSPDGTVQVLNYFRARRAPPEGYTFFMHVLDATSGQLAANADHAINLPDGRWPIGSVVEDGVSLRVPPGMSLELRLGFYRGEQRLPVDAAAMQDGDNRVRGPVLGDAKPLPTYVAHRRSGPVHIDGHLDDAAWAAAAPVLLTRSLDGAPVSLRTAARLLYDDAFLYVAFDCEDPDVWGTFRERDQELYTQEVVEIFLDASADGRTYHEIEVSPHNVVFDAYFPARRQGMDLSWDSGIESAVWVRGTLDDPSDKDQGWSVEMKIPLKNLKDLPPGKPLRGTKWRFNLYRLDLPDRRNAEGQAFSPLYIGDFHNLPRFGWLSFD